MLLLRKWNLKIVSKTKFHLVFIVFLMANLSAFGQLSATFTTTINTVCNGSGCDYTGPSILINELMISPSSNDGSMSGDGGISAGRGEWIELYNPNLCEPVDISCYYLGNYTGEGTGGYVIPAGTIIPPAGFCMVRGSNMTAVPANLLVQNGGNVVELIVPTNVTDNGVCSNGSRLWFPNAGGWFAFYDANGVPQDAVSWVTSSTNTSGAPCVATLGGCNAVTSLASYDNIPANRKNWISNQNASNHVGQSLRRTTDGGAWPANLSAAFGAPTYGTCNSNCVTPGISTCTGTATVNPAGGTAPYTFIWNDSQAQLTQTATGLCAGTYAVTVTDDIGQSQQFSVQVEDLVPTVSLNLVDDVCIDLAAFPLTIASPTPAVGQTGVFSGNGVSGSDFNPATAGAGTQTITYVFTDENECTNSATDQIIVNPLPVVSISGVANPYCVSNPTLQFVLSPAGGTLSGPGVTGTSFNPATAGVGSHTLTYNFTDANGCSNSTSTTVQVVGLPTPSITAPATICANDNPVTLVGSPVGGTFFINATQTNNLNPATLAAGVQNITYNFTDQFGCQASATAQTEVFAVPAVSVNLVSAICIDGGTVPITLSPANGNGGNGVLQGNGVLGSNFNPQTAGVGQHTITYLFTTPEGCVNTATDLIAVNALPVVTFTGINPTYCISNVAVNFNLTPAGGTLSGPGVTNNSFVPSSAGVGTHTLTYTFTDANSCTSSTTGNVTVVAVPSPTITTPPFLCNYASAITLVGTPTGGVFTVDGTQTTTFNPASLSDGTHDILYTYTDANNCIATATETIDVLPRPILTNSIATSYCFGSPDVLLTLTPAGGTLTGTMVSGNTLQIGGEAPGNYSVTYDYTDANGCANTLVSPFVITSPILANYSYSTDCFQNGIFVNLTSPSGTYQYNWNINNTLNSSFINPTIKFSQFGDQTITLTVTDQYNCSYDTTMSVFIPEGVSMKDYVIPNVITPNGDGINDVIQLPILFEECLSYKILILNRWGNIVYEMTSASNAFTGKDANGRDLQDGVYFYTVESEDFDCESDEFRGFCSGFFTVIRK
jgi:gliding motility-associated-like protein